MTLNHMITDHMELPRTEAHHLRDARSILILLIVAIAAALVALSGNGSNLPLASHEAYVARSAEEMIARNDWIVPHFNGQPRINKPPLAYWLTIAVDWLNGRDGVISEWEARVPPIIGSVVLACGAAAIGITFFGSWAGLLAGLFACTCSGYSSYSHSARPEMLYAAMCTLGMAGFALACRLNGEERRAAATSAAWFGWLSFGLAILTKGPHLPALIIVGWIIGMIAAGERGRIRASLKPLTGLIIMNLVWIWWYVLIRARVPNWLELLEQETTSGRIFNFDHFGAWSYLDPYYIYRTLGLVLPWVVLYPIVLGAPWLAPASFGPRVRMLWWAMIVPLLLLHISLGRRWYYLLPVLAPFAVLMAKFALDIARHLVTQRQAGTLLTLAMVHIIGFAIAMPILRRLEPEFTAPTMAGTIAVIVASALVALALLTLIRQSRHAAEATVVAVAGLAVIFLAAAQFRTSLWDEERFNRRDFALRLAEMIPPDAPLYGWSGDWAREVYYGHRVIPEFEEKSQLRAALEQQGGGCWMLVELPLHMHLQGEFDKSIVMQTRIEKGNSVELWRIEQPSLTEADH